MEGKVNVGTDEQWTCICMDGTRIKISLQQFVQHSGYFAAMLRSDVQEHLTKEISLELLSVQTLSHIQNLLDILSSQQFEIEAELQVFEIFSHLTELSEMDLLLTAIDYLDMHKLRKLCDKFFCSLHESNMDNLSYLLHLCTNFTLKQLEKKILSYLLENLCSMLDSETINIVKILPFPLLKRILESNKANVSSEWDLVRVLDEWAMSHCQNNADEKNILELGKCIRILSLTESENYEKRLAEIRNTCLRNQIKTGMCEMEDDEEKYLINYPLHSQKRRGQSILLAMRVPFGNKLDRACSFSKDFSVENNEDIVFNENHHLSRSIPCEALREFCVCTHGQYVYVAGGQRKYSLAGQFAVSDVYRLDLDKLQWTTVKPMSVERCLFHMETLSKQLYAVGGINIDGELSSVEKYDPVTDMWTPVQSLDYKIHEHAGCGHGKVMYICGGHDGTSHVDTLCRYDGTSDTWSRCAPMLTTRSCHSVIRLNDRLYVIGGSKIKKFKVYGMQTIECYSTTTDQWCEVRAEFPSVYTACLSIYSRSKSSQLLVLGGYSYKRHAYTLEMHSFCERTCSWVKVPISFNSRRKDQREAIILEVKVNKHLADQLLKNKRSCTLK
ncbi:kelch-like protein 13 [Haliotis asinina]|uniref:kelch-like protein 13 n=1 Tax=Haliotis asinina TaxID=109174 RepID=UPI0035321F0D